MRLPEIKVNRTIINAFKAKAVITIEITTESQLEAIREAPVAFAEAVAYAATSAAATSDNSPIELAVKTIEDAAVAKAKQVQATKDAVRDTSQLQMDLAVAVPATAPARTTCLMNKEHLLVLGGNKYFCSIECKNAWKSQVQLMKQAAVIDRYKYVMTLPNYRILVFKQFDKTFWTKHGAHFSDMGTKAEVLAKLRKLRTGDKVDGITMEQLIPVVHPKK